MATEANVTGTYLTAGADLMVKKRIIKIISCIYNVPNDALSANRMHIPYKDNHTIHTQDTHTHTLARAQRHTLK